MQGAYANTIGMANPGFAANQVAGTAMSGIAGVGAPVATMGLSMLGLDPMSLGLKAGMAALPTLGIGGALGAGAAVAAPAALAWYGASAVGDQVMTGMQQQQDLNMAMRQNFGQFQNRGTGWSNQQLAGLGQQIRGMTHEIGAGGEMQSFRELASLASNMGRMGFVQTTRDVQQFSQKFRQMVDTLKTVARDLGTNLETAQEMVVGMRGSGIFNTADQIRMAQTMRGNAVAGNISTQETGAMASIGSQIARSVGGRGRAGAFAGAATIGQIGTALESGTLREEDIYNATGLTGAEGRQALATSMMQRSAQFLRSSRGRVMLASLAGQNGQLDERSVQQLMSGGMDISGTMGGIGRNLGKVGALNFMRNEGKLRGAVLERFGGNVQAMQLMQWAGGAGIDIESMGDREMMFAQRMIGMSYDDLNAAVKMARDLQHNAQFAGERQSQDRYTQQIRQRQSRRGIEGARNAFNQFREKVQGGLQEVGQSLYNSASNWVERQINEMTGLYASSLTDDIRNAYLEYERTGGRGTAAQGNMIFGALRGGGPKVSAQATRAAQERLGGGSVNMSDLQRYERSAQGGVFGGLFGKTMEDETGFRFRSNIDSGRLENMRKGAWRGATLPFVGGAPGAMVGAITGLFTRNVGAEALRGVEFGRYQRETGALIEGAKSVAGEGDLALATQMKDMFGDVATTERLSGLSGEEYLQEFNKIMQERGQGAAKERWDKLWRQTYGANTVTKDGKIVVGGRTKQFRELGAYATALGVAGGLGPGSAFSARSGSPFDKLAGLGKFSTEETRAAAHGEALTTGYALAAGEAGVEQGLGDFFGGRGAGATGQMRGKLGFWSSVAGGAATGAGIGLVSPVLGGATLGALGGGALGAADYYTEGRVSGYLRDLVTGGSTEGLIDENVGKAAYAFLKTEEGSALATRAAFGERDKKFIDKLDKDVREMGTDIKNNKDPTVRAKYEVMKASLAAAKLRENEDPQAVANRLYKMSGMDEKTALTIMEGQVAGLTSSVVASARERTLELASEGAGRAAGEMEKLQQTGLYEPTGELRGNLRAALTKAGAGGLVQYATGQMTRWQELQKAGHQIDPMLAMRHMEAATTAVGGSQLGLRGMSSAQLAAAAKTLGSTEGGESLLPTVQREQALERRAARMFAGGDKHGIATALGVTGQQNLFNVMRAKTTEGMIAQIEEATGAELSSDQRKQLGDIRKMARGESVVAGQRKRRATAIERAKGKGDEEGMVTEDVQLSGGAAKREAAEQLGRMRRDLERQQLEKSKGERLADQKLENPLQEQILNALNRIADGMTEQVRDEKSGTKTAMRKVSLDPASATAIGNAVKDAIGT